MPLIYQQDPASARVHPNAVRPLRTCGRVKTSPLQPACHIGVPVVGSLPPQDVFKLGAVIRRQCHWASGLPASLSLPNVEWKLAEDGAIHAQLKKIRPDGLKMSIAYS